MDESIKIYLADGTTKDVPVIPRSGESRAAVQHKIELETLLSNDKRVQRANMRRSEMIRLLGEGIKPSEAAKDIGIRPSTYYEWRKHYPAFRGQCDLAVQKFFNSLKAEDVTSWKTFSSFRKRFFGLDTYYPHAQVIDAIETTQAMEVCLILVAPETGKTTLLEDKICEILARDPDHRIAYISESSGHSVKVAGRVRRRMTDMAEFGDYIARFGPFYQKGQEKEGKSWTTHFFTVNKASHDERDYSFEARGANSNIQGSRVDTLFCDDIQSLKSLSGSDDLLNKFRQEWITRVGRVGRVVIVGNRIGIGDIYEKMIEADLIHKLVEIPVLNADGDSVIPELWTNEELEKRRKQVGPDIWARTYMQDPISAGNNTFDPETRDAAKDVNRVIKLNAERSTIMSLDPGLMGGNCLTVAQFTDTKLEVVDQIADYALGRTEGILSRVEFMAEKYRPTELIIEMMAFQQALGKDDRMYALAQKYGFRLYPHTTGDNKYDMIFGVGSMATSMRAGEMTIPWGDEHSREVFQPLLEEMIVWKPNKRGTQLRQDRIMSLWFIHLYWMRLRNVINFEEKKQVIRARALPWKPTQFKSIRGKT